MSRLIKGANSEIFTRFDQFCAARGVHLANAGSPRWIASRPMHRHFMSASLVRDNVSFTAARKLARLELGPKIYFCAIGFEHPNPLLGAVEVPLNPAFLTVILAELAPRPRATTAQIRDVVEIGDQGSEPSYAGHDFESIAGLFPPIRIFELPQIPQDATWKVFFKLCIEECEFGDSWMDGRLSETLRSVCDLDPDKIPYRVLCRSVFDGDPSNFYLALYRCLEALYAFSSAQRIVSELDLKNAWAEVAAVLENQLGWHPREESSLGDLLEMADMNDLKAVRALIDENKEQIDTGVLASRTARRIYWLRNSIVHFRPAQYSIDLQRIDWNELCGRMASIVCYVYSEIFP